MTTYNTYQEAKIAMPLACIIHDTDDDIFFGMPSREGTTLNDDGCKFAEPHDYCMTVEKFLADGNKFVEGDFILDEGSVYLLTDCKTQNYWYETESANEPDCNDNRRHVLHAAALEEKEPELTKDDSPQGVISAISNRLHNIGCEHQDSELGEELGSMACDIWGVLPLISNESIQEKKPRTKVEYVKCEFIKLSDAAKAVDGGDIQFNNFGNQPVDDKALALHYYNNGTLSFYRRIETQITWKEELYDYLDNSCEMSDDFDDSFTIEIEGKPLEFNLNDDEFVDMCKFVASLNSVN